MRNKIECQVLRSGGEQVSTRAYASHRFAKSALLKSNLVLYTCIWECRSLSFITHAREIFTQAISRGGKTLQHVFFMLFILHSPP